MNADSLVSLSLLGIAATALVFVAGRLSKSPDARDNKAAWPFGMLGILALSVCIMLFQEKGSIAGYGLAYGKPATLQLGETYDLVPSDELYLKLKDKSGSERVYAIDDKLLPPFDRCLIPKLVEQFKYEKHEQLFFVPVSKNPPKTTPPTTPEKTVENEKK